MTDNDGAMYALLDRAADGPVAQPPIGRLLEAGRRRLRRRRAGQVSAVGLAVAVIVAGAVIVSGNTAGTAKPPPTATATPLPGPSARQLANGHWVRMPTPPVTLCNPAAVWDGSDLVVFGPKFNSCASSAATYDPRTNRWARIAPPPADVGPAPVAAWGGGRLVLVSTTTGATEAWQPGTNSWRQLSTLPAAGANSLLWTGNAMLAITTSPTGPAEAFSLVGSGWTRLPDLPRPPEGAIDSTATAVYGGSVYAFVGVSVVNRTRHSGSVTGMAEILTFDHGRWSVSPTYEVLESQLSMTQLDRSILTIGTGCPAAAACTLDDVQAFLLVPGNVLALTELRPPAGMPDGPDIAGGADTVVVTYTNGFHSVTPGLPPASGPTPGTTMAYDAASQRWIRGPTMPASGVADGTYWTPYGVVSLGSFTGTLASVGGSEAPAVHTVDWLLRPAN